MKIIFTLLCLGLICTTSAQRCLTAEYASRHPVSKLNLMRGQGGGTSGRDTLKDEVIIIPVVIHVVYHTDAQNISDAQILSQLKILNDDYRRKNADAVNTPAPFRGVAADTRIQFCLARVDPEGRLTTGIIRKYTGEGQFLADDAVKFSAQGGDDAWDASKYLNLWVCNLFGRTLGYAVLPGSPAEKDGVVIKYDVFGNTGYLTPPYTKGRTATHEIGHWLGLKHLWGDSFCGDDGIADTPPQETSNSNCPVFPHLSSCSNSANGDMFMDFMDFSDDGCMNLFTQGQKAEMRGLFALGGPRNSFLNSNVCDSSNAEGGPLPVDPPTPELTITVYPNPFNSQLTIATTGETQVVGKTLRLYDIAGKLVASQIIESSHTVLNTSGLRSGIYILKIEGKTNNFVYKLIKQAEGSGR
jgi:hypothetical protein